MKGVALVLLALSAVSAFGQTLQLRIKPQPIQIRVRHADPWAIKTMLEGGQLRSPELSTILALMGGPPPQGQTGGNPLFPDGKFIVNPGDNSLWYVPNP